LIDGVGEGTLLVAADSGLILAEAAGLKPDWIIGDMDSLDSEQRLRSYPADKVIRHHAAKDFTDTELALDLLWDKGCGEAWIAGGGGGRIDHLFGIRDLFERERFPRRWLTAAEDIHCIDGDDGAANLTVMIEQGGVVSVFPLGDGSWKAHSSGLKWPLDNVQWKRGLYGLSNVAMESEITINARQGRFMIIMEGMWRRA
jgi:thiamine pyrophosphokinase